MHSGFHDGFDGESLEGGSAAEYGYPEGLSVWAVGAQTSVVLTKEGLKVSRRGPVPGTKMPPSITVGRERAAGTKGRLACSHQFLDVARYRVRPKRKKRKPVPLCWDRLRDFREVVWFLVLAGYSPNYIGYFFRLELPNLFPKLSYRAVRYSVRKTQKLAEAGKVILDDEFSDTLEDYKAGPWAHNAPDWLREQYGVPLAEPKPGGKDSRKGKGKDSGKDVAGEAVVVKTPEEIQRGIVFWDSWTKYSSSRSGIPDPTPEEIVLGEAQGISAVLIRRQAAGVSVGVGTGEIPVSPGVGSGVSSPAVAAVPAGPAGPGDSVVAEERSAGIARVFEAVTQLEASTGVRLNLTTAEFLEAVDSGLPFVLTKRLGSGSSGGSVSAGSTVAPAVKEPVVPDGLGNASVGGGKPVDSHGVDSAVAKGSGDLVAPVEPGKDLGLDGVGGVAEKAVEEIVPEIVPGSVLELSPQKRVVREPSPLDSVPASEWLRFAAFGIAPGVRGVVGGKPVDPWNIGGVPRVWKIDADFYIGAGEQPSDFYLSLGDAAPYLVERVTDETYAPWVLAGDHGFGLYSRFGGKDPKENFDMEGFFPTWLPVLNTAPKVRDPKDPNSSTYQKSMFYWTLQEAKACFDEWDQRDLADTTEIQDNLGTKHVMTIVGPNPMLMDLVERGMGPAYWEVHESFLIHWILGLAVRQACGFSTKWGHEGGRRYIPLVAVPSVEAAMAASEARLLYLRPWRSTSPLYTETLAPRCASENLPGHVWVTGLGYLPTKVFRDIQKYVVHGGDNHPDFKGVPRDVVVTMINWCNDIVSRVNARRFVSDPMRPELGNHFVDSWNKAVSKKALGVDGISRSVCSPLFCESGSVAVLFGMKRGLLFHQASMLHLDSETRTRWDFAEGFPKLREWLVKIPISVHMPSLYGATAYLQFLENRRPLIEGLPYRGVKFPENQLLPEDKVPFPSDVEDQPFRRRFRAALTRDKDYF